ncbi:nucleoside hydrolase [Microbacterium gilvum]|uniref:Inosine/uridine-preferring nucleoside hydrolase domain-containing protein n=1 Tax=Microbacterium gilvum TaxID=1336204 RepID=A0ABP9AQ92_9MICO
MTAFPAVPRQRIIVDNDFSGDPDDLVQMAHHALSPAVDIRLVIGSHLSPGDPFDPSETQADNAAAIASDLLSSMGRDDIPVLAGAQNAIPDRGTPHDTAAARAIIAEAMRDDTDLPLVFCAGAGLTELASALLLEPRIAERMTLVWIGGVEHDGLAVPPPDASPVEYNLAIDVAAAQVVFDSAVPIWQVPRDAYRQVLVSADEIDLRIRPHGALGARLADAISRVAEIAAGHGLPLGETYALGDSPLVLLTSLRSSFQADPSSSDYVLVPRPAIRDDGGYASRPERAPIRVYRRLDVRLLLEDLYAKLQRAAA